MSEVDAKEPIQVLKSQAPPIVRDVEQKARQYGHYNQAVGPVAPRDSDILKGQGTGNYGREGGQALIDLTSSCYEHFKALNDVEKCQFCNDIVLALKHDGHRFLERRADQSWHEMTQQAAYKKVRTRFKTIKRKCRDEAAAWQESLIGEDNAAGEIFGPRL